MRLYLVCVGLLLMGCREINAEMVSFHAESEWRYRFFPDGTFTMSTAGHVGQSQIVGSYSKVGNTLVLTSSDEVPHEGNVEERFYVVTDEVWVGKSGNLYRPELPKFTIADPRGCDLWYIEHLLINHLDSLVRTGELAPYRFDPENSKTECESAGAGKMMDIPYLVYNCRSISGQSQGIYTIQRSFRFVDPISYEVYRYGDEGLVLDDQLSNPCR